MSLSLTEKLARFLELADTICNICREVDAAYSVAINIIGRALSPREHISATLYAKMYHSYIALIADVRENRSEAMHHLKTLIECALYQRWIYRNETETDERALLLFVKSCNENLKFFNKNKSYEMYATDWKAIKQSGLNNIPPKLQHMLDKNIIEFCEKDEHALHLYNAIYRYACQPAHMGDLHFFVNGRKTEGFLCSNHAASAWCLIAIDYGTSTSIEMLQSVMSDKLWNGSDFQSIIHSRLSELLNRVIALRE